MSGTRLLYPKFKATDLNGFPLAGGTVEVFEAGSTTPAVTYADYNLTAPNSFPIVLDASGSANIFLSYSARYKVRVKDSNGAIIDTQDDVDPSVGTNFGDAGTTTIAADPWVETATTPIYVDATHFNLVGDQTGSIEVGSRIKYSLVGGTGYATVKTISYSSPNTNVEIETTGGSIAMDATVARTYYTFFRPSGPPADAGAITYSTVQSYPVSGTVGNAVKALGTAVTPLSNLYGATKTFSTATLAGAVRASAIAQTTDVYALSSAINFGAGNSRPMYFSIQVSITSAIDAAYQAKPYEFLFTLRPQVTGSVSGIIYYGTVVDKFQVNYTGSTIVRAYTLTGIINQPSSGQNWTLGLSVDIQSFNGANSGNVNGGVAFATATALRAQSIDANYSIYQV